MRLPFEGFFIHVLSKSDSKNKFNVCDIVKISKSLTLKSTSMVLSKNNRAIADDFNIIYPVYNVVHNNGFKNWVCRDTEEVL